MSDAFRPALAAHPWMWRPFGSRAGAARRVAVAWEPAVPSSPLRRARLPYGLPALSDAPAWRGFGMMLISAIW